MLRRLAHAPSSGLQAGRSGYPSAVPHQFHLSGEKEIVEDLRNYFGGCSIAFSDSGMVRPVDLWGVHADKLGLAATARRLRLDVCLLAAKQTSSPPLIFCNPPCDNRARGNNQHVTYLW